VSFISYINELYDDPMGRTIPSFRIASLEEQKEWKSFKKALDKSARKMFDDIFSIAHLYNSSCSYAANPIRIQPIFMSIIFHHYKQLTKLSETLGIDRS
jgi:hypothetical protein